MIEQQNENNGPGCLHCDRPLTLENSWEYADVYDKPLDEMPEVLCDDCHAIEMKAHLDKEVPGGDLHAHTARQVFGVEKVTEEQRSFGKALNYLACYNTGLATLRKIIERR